MSEMETVTVSRDFLDRIARKSAQVAAFALAVKMSPDSVSGEELGTAIEELGRLLMQVQDELKVQS